MGRDAAVASPPIAAGAAETERGHEAVVIDVDGAPAAAAFEVDGAPTAAAAAAAHGLACRICHLSPEGEDGPAAAPGSEVIRLGCGCKGELGAAHRQCAEAWFRIKGDIKWLRTAKLQLLHRRCEICGSDAKNITGLEVKKFMEKWHGRRVTNTGATVERENTCWRRQPFCNCLLASLLIAFMLPWFFRVHIF